MARISIKSKQLHAHKMILRHGGLGYLVRNGAKRQAVMAYMEYSPKERELSIDTTAKLRVSVINLQIAPSHEQDSIIYKGSAYNIAKPVEGPRIDGDFVYYDCHVLYTGKV